MQFFHLVNGVFRVAHRALNDCFARFPFLISETRRFNGTQPRRHTRPNARVQTHVDADWCARIQRPKAVRISVFLRSINHYHKQSGKCLYHRWRPLVINTEIVQRQWRLPGNSIVSKSFAGWPIEVAIGRLSIIADVISSQIFVVGPKKIFLRPVTEGGGPPWVRELGWPCPRLNWNRPGHSLGHLFTNWDTSAPFLVH